MEEFRKSLVKFRMPSVPSIDTVVFQWWEEGHEDTFEEAILSIGSSMTALEFRESANHALHLAVPGAVNSLVLFLDLESNELAYFEDERNCKHLPKQGVVWEAVRRRAPDMLKKPIPKDDPIYTLMPSLQPLEEGQVVLLNPIVEKKDHRVVAFLLAICSEPSLQHIERIQWLEKNVLVAASRVLKHTAAEKSKSRAEGMLHVCGDLIDLDTACLTVKILKHLKQIMEAKMCYMFILDENTQELVCQVFNEVPIDAEIRIPSSDSRHLYTRCFLTGETIIIKDTAKDVMFNPAVDVVNGYEPSMMICMPVKVQREDRTKPEVIAVAVACDKQKGKMFSSRDHDNMRFVLRFSSSVLANTLAFQRELTLKKQNQALLQIARKLFSNLSDLELLLQEIMNEARSLTDAEQCSVFLLTPHTNELVAKVFDSELPDKQKTITVKVGQGIAGYVAETGKVVNIRDAYKHPNFFKDVDKNTGFHTKNILCFPIKLQQEIVGVAQLCNKVGGKFFTKYDEELAITFSVYCGISLHRTRLFEQLKESQSRNNLANEIMLYHMNVPPEETEILARSDIPSCSMFDERFADLTYYPSNVEDSDTVVAVMSMMNEMDLITKWRLEKDTLARFILRVKKGYRHPPYHNWVHAFSVTHFCYGIYKNCSKLDILDDIEILALFVSCLCHDIDHRGTNNAFQVRSNSPLASLYSSEGSVLERHHFAQTISILNSQGCRLFDHLSPADYKRVLDLMQLIILATDIADHLRKMKDISKMANDGYDRSDPTHHKLMCSVLMTACDLCFNTKSWDVSKEVSKLLYQEFFTQGDLEKALGETPIEMMDKDKAFVPAQQVGFLTGIAGPVYKVVSQMLPGLDYCYKAFEANMSKWIELNNKRPSPERSD